MTINTNITQTNQTSLQESQETAAQTQTEAAKGDRQAARKLAAENAAQPAANIVNSNQGILNAKA